MKTKQQISILSVLMVIVLVALTLGGLQLFGKGNVKPSEWFKSSDTQTEQSKDKNEDSTKDEDKEEDSSKNEDKDSSEDTNEDVNGSEDEGKTAETPEVSGELGVEDAVSVSSYSVMPLAAPSNATSDFSFNEKVGVQIDGEQYQYNQHSYDLYIVGKVSYIGVSGMTRTYYVDFTVDISSIKDLFENFGIVQTISASSGVRLMSESCILEGNSLVVEFSFSCDSKSYLDKIGVVRFIYVSFDTITFELPEAPEKEGYHFVGWYYDAEFQRPYDGAPIYADTTLYPKYEINTYTVTFSVGYGKAVEPITVEWNSTIETLPTTTRVGYDFVEWMTVDGKTFDKNTPIKSDLTLYAKFKIKTFKVTFFNSDGSVYKEVYVNYGTRLSVVAASEGISYKSFYALDGKKLARTTIIAEDVEITVEDMATDEKIGTFMSEHIWVFWTMIAVMGFLTLLSGAFIVVFARK